MNSTAIALVIVIVLMYMLMCINNKIELVDAVTVSLAGMLAGLGILSGMMAVLGIFSINKALAVLLALSVLAALLIMLSGRKPGFMLKSSQGYIKPVFRAILLCCLAIVTKLVLEYPAAEQEDALLAATEVFNRYLWCVLGIALLLLLIVDFIVRFAGYTKAQQFAEKTMPIIAVAAVVAAAFVILIKAANTGTSGVVYAAGSLAGAVIAALGLAGLYRKRDFVELLVLAVSEYIMAYLLTAGMLIAWNAFSIGRGVVGAVLLVSLLDSIIFAVKRQKPQVTFAWRRNLAGIGVCLAVIPLSFSTFGMFGIGQDEGVYQAKAIGYIYGSNDNYLSFSEYDKIDTKEEKSEYMKNLGNYLAGYNFVLDEEDLSRAGDEVVQNDTLGNLHGIHTFSALLGLYGSVAGVENMLQMGTWLLILSLFLLWLVLGNLGIHTVYKVMVMVLYAVSPQILWQARTSLVETTLAFLILVYLYLITDKKNGNYRWLSCFPIAVFSVVHITIYVFMPLFMLIFYGLYFATGKKRYMGAAIVSIVTYLGGFYMMYVSSLTYVYGNYDRLYIHGIGTDNIKEFVTAVCAAAILLSILFAAIPAKKHKYDRHKKARRILWKVLVYIFVVLGVAGCGYAAVKSTYPFSYVTIYAYMLGSGIVFLPVTLLAALIKPGLFQKDSSIVILSAMFYYCVIIYSAVFKKEILYYYYYGRYIVPYLAIIMILGAYAVCNLEKGLLKRKHMRAGKIVETISAFAALFVVCLLLPYTAVVTTQQDETEVQWEVLTEIAALVDEDAAVVIHENVVPQFMLPLKYMTGADVYIPMQDTTAQFDRLKEQYSHVYLLMDEEEISLEHMDSIYHKDNKIWMDVKMPEELSGMKALIPYAEEFEEFLQPLTVYEYSSE